MLRALSFLTMITAYKSPRQPATWRTRGVVIGLSGGLIAPLLGSALTIITWFRDPAWHGLPLHTAATTLFVVTLPLLLLGAHCLDLLDKQTNAGTGDRQEDA